MQRVVLVAELAWGAVLLDGLGLGRGAVLVCAADEERAPVARSWRQEFSGASSRVAQDAYGSICARATNQHGQGGAQTGVCTC